jgi:hypothetical protein
VRVLHAGTGLVAALKTTPDTSATGEARGIVVVESGCAGPDAGAELCLCVYLLTSCSTPAEVAGARARLELRGIGRAGAGAAGRRSQFVSEGALRGVSGGSVKSRSVSPPMRSMTVRTCFRISSVLDSCGHLVAVTQGSVRELRRVNRSRPPAG